MLAIDCSKIEYHPTGPGRWLLNVLRHWPVDLPARLYFRRQIPHHDFLNQKSFGFRISDFGFFSKVDPIWRHFVLPRALKRDKVSLLLEPFYIPLLTWPPEKTVLCIADISYKRHPEWFPRRSQLRWFPDRLVKRVRHIITISEFSKREIMDYYGIPEERITVTPLAADEKFRPLPLSPGKTVGGSTSSSYFLFWGDLNTRRHPREMIEAFVKNQESRIKNQDLSFVIVGRDITQPTQNILGLIQHSNERLGRQAIIHYEYPSDAELVRLVQGALAAVYLSDYEGFGMPVLEAMACGVPVITSSTSSLPEVGGNAASYIKNNADVAEIAGAMERIAYDAELRKRLQSKGTDQAGRFSWMVTAEKTIALLKSLSSI